MSRPKIRIAVNEDAQPVIDALQALHVDIGSVRMSSLYADKPDSLAKLPAEWHDMRWLCVALASVDEIDEFAQRLAAELIPLPAAISRHCITLTENVLVMPLPLETVMLVFTEIPAVEVHENG